jgi:hypothetical protein
MKLLRRILTTIVVTLAIIYGCLYWAAPVALSFYAAKKALTVARVVPSDLKDVSISQTPGTKLSYVGYEFEVPWSDLDDSKTKLYPQNNPDKTMAILTFQSGLRMMVTAIPPREFADEFIKKDFKLSPQQVEAVFGKGTTASDYQFVKNVYEFTPDKMHYWSLSRAVHVREWMMLMIKSIMPTKGADSGIFRVRNEDFRGFQQGAPQICPDRLIVTLYRDDDKGGLEIALFQKGCPNHGVTQPEINRIIRSLRQVAPSEVLSSAR